MAYEDSGDYTEVDEVADIEIVSASCVEFDARRNQYAYLYKDFTASYFGDFEIHGKVHYDNIYTGSTGSLGYFNMFANAIGEGEDLHTAGEKLVFLNCYYSSGTLFGICNYDGVDGTSDYMLNWLAVTPRYYIFSRTGTTGQVEIYSDEEMTTLVDTLSLTVQGDTFRYFYWVNSHDSNSSSSYLITNLTPENLEFISSESETGETNYPNYFSGKGLFLAAPPEQ